MAVQFIFPLIIGLTGVHSITTVSEVSVKPGGSVTIPCLYDSKYENHVKYLCKGNSWSSCEYAIKTNQPHSSRKFSISDDKTQRIFTVTIKDLMYGDTDYYWCIVEINNRPDVGQHFHLSVTWGTSSLYVDHQEITGFNGDSISISCRSQNSGEMKWCRLGSSCVTGSSGSLDRTTVTINTMTRYSFTVTMSQLRTENSGWYLCVKGDLQMPVHLTVTEKPTTTTQANLTLKPNNTSISGDQTNNADNNQHRGPCCPTFDLKSLLIPLGLLIVIVMVTLLVWFKLNKHKQIRAESPASMKAEEEVTYSDVKHTKKPTEQDTVYCNVGYMRRASAQTSHTEADVDVMYSSVVTLKRQTVRRDEAEDPNVAYSALAQHHQQI